MPFLDDDSVRALVGDAAHYDHLLDLRGASVSGARSAISQVLEWRQSADSASVVIRIDKATATSGETLFLPVGRQLLEARKRGLVSRLHPLAEAGGFYVELPAQARGEGAQQ